VSEAHAPLACRHHPQPAEHLGEVEAKDEAEAFRKAAEMYDIPSEPRNRITARKITRKD